VLLFSGHGGLRGGVIFFAEAQPPLRAANNDFFCFPIRAYVVPEASSNNTVLLSSYAASCTVSHDFARCSGVLGQGPAVCVAVSYGGAHELFYSLQLIDDVHFFMESLSSSLGAMQSVSTRLSVQLSDTL
jgi:hypothetical protein